jgi:predicted Zn-dependent peptidase
MVGFDSGSRLEREYGVLDGTAHMLEHSIFKGTAKRSAVDISKDIGYLGGFTNAFTSHEMVGYYITVPYENLEPAVEILSDIILNSKIPEEEFLKEVEVVKEEEISRLDDVDSYMWSKFSPGFFDNYISNPVIGTQESISSFTRDGVYSFYRNFCKRDKAAISISGNHSSRQVKRIVSRHFGGESNCSLSNYSGGACNYSSGSRADITKPGIEHSYMWIAYPGIDRESPLSAPAKVLSCILGAGMDSRLFCEVRESRGLAYSIGSSLSQWQTASMFSIESSSRADNIDSIIEISLGELERLTESLVTEEEIERANNKIRSSFYSTLESSYGVASYELRRSLFGLDSIDQLMKDMASVSRADILKAAVELFKGKSPHVLTCGPE